MIEWIKYEKNSFLEEGKPYLVHDYQGFITVGKNGNSNNGSMWKEIYDGELIRSVTHYAELNFPVVFNVLPQATESTESPSVAAAETGIGGSYE